MDKKEKVRQIDLRNLPRKNNLINWKESIGCKVPFQYDDIKGEVEIIGYDIINHNGVLNIKYKNKKKKIRISDFRRCKIGDLLNKITSNFKVEIGQNFKDNKRDITIINKEKRIGNKNIKYKWYKYHCNKCDYEGWITEGHLLSNRKDGCSFCASKKVIKGFNDISTTNPELVKYFCDINDTYNHTIGSGKKVLCKCPNCGYKKQVCIYELYKHGIRCPQCSDGISYPEKFMICVLTQLEIKFKYQLTKNIFKWCDKYKYDFYFEYNNKKYIIETHGKQHYAKNCFYNDTPKKQQEIDKIKKEIALKNGIDKYIEIDCSKSNLEYIKNNILKSELNNIFNMSKINWVECERYAVNSLIKIACEYKKNNKTLSCSDISKEMNIDRHTILRWLKIGNELNLCVYNVEKENREGKIKAGKSNGKPIEMFKDNISIGIFESATELERQSEKLFGIKLWNTGILNVCLNKQKKHKGFVFKYFPKDKYKEIIEK